MTAREWVRKRTSRIEAITINNPSVEGTYVGIMKRVVTSVSLEDISINRLVKTRTKTSAILIELDEADMLTSLLKNTIEEAAQNNRLSRKKKDCTMFWSR